MPGETATVRERAYSVGVTTRQLLRAPRRLRFPRLGVTSNPAVTGFMAAPRPRLLLVEDEATISVALGRLLDRWGFDTLAARTAAEARAVLDGTQVDVVVLDLRLPDMRGDDLFRVIARDYPTLARRVLFITGDFSNDGLEAIERTGRPYLLKPFELGIFVHELRTLIDPLLGPGNNGHGAEPQSSADASAA